MGAIENDPGRYERMSLRAPKLARKAYLSAHPDLVETVRSFLAERPDLDPADRAAILAAPVTVMHGPKFESVQVQYDPRRYHWSAAETYAANRGECRECYTARPSGEGQRHFGWALWLTCDRRRCEHAHHADEVWLASAG